MPIIPDTKDWTWVVDTPCADCGFDAATVAATDVASMLRANAAAWPAVLERDDVRVRPDDSTWSPLEYAAHVRDVFLLYRQRLELMRSSDDPLYPNWDQDEAALTARYIEQDPAVVAVQLAAAAAPLADDFDAVSDWTRVGRRSDGARFTIESFGVYLLHDAVHHLHDVAASLAQSMS